MRKVLVVFLAMLFALSIIAGCNKSDNTSKEKDISYSNNLLIEDGETEYTLLLENSDDTLISQIEDEFSTFIYDFSNCKIKVSKEEMNFSKNSKVISIGNTTFAQGSGITNNSDNLLESGYRMKTYGDSIVIWGNTNYASLCGMYDFFEKVFNLKIYSVDEMSFVKKEKVNLPIFDSEVIPSIDLRAAPSWMVASDIKYTSRLKMRVYASMFISIENTNMATTFALMPKSKYFDEHRDWYNNDGTDLCYSNEEMQTQMIENLKYYIEKNPDCNRVMVGQEDNCSWCSCEKCSKTISEYGNTNVSTAILCINRVEEEINEWLKGKGESRVVKFGIFAYQKSINAPAVREDGKWKPLLKCNPNIFIMYAPIEADYFYSFSDSQNEEFANIIEAWNACADEILVWSYGANFNWYLIDFPNWESLQSTFQYLNKQGVKMNFTQCPYDMSGMPNAPTFANLRAYLISNLLFDCNMDYQQLIDDFFINYYKDASEYIYKYFSELRDLEIYNVLQNGMSGFCGSNLLNEIYWPKATLLRWEGYINEAYKSIEHLKDENPELYETLYWRINKESLSIRYLLLDIYSFLYDSVELQNLRIQFMDDMNTLKIYDYKEGRSASELYSSWGIL